MKKKIYNLKELIPVLNRLKKNNKTIVWTNGCFDIIHYGHICYLEKAKKLGNILVVGLNTDKSVKINKGNNRPIFSLKYRAKVVSALECVDFVTYFNEKTPYNAIKKIMPHYIVKGGDYNPENVVGKDIVEKYGFGVVIIPFEKGFSTSNILKAIDISDTTFTAGNILKAMGD